MTTKVAVVGATGKMGQLASQIIEASDDFELVAQIDSKGELSEMLGADIAVDVTLPGVSQRVVEYAVANGINVLVGTSGWSSDRIASLERTINGNLSVGVIIIPNFSIGSVLATAFAALAAQFFDSIEIIEAHHAGKSDSPSGTAVRTAELIGAARAKLGPVIAPHADQRARGQQVSSVPIHSLRMQGVVEYAVAHGVSVLVGTSGWSNERIASLERTIDGNLAVGVIIVPNFSIGSVLATSFAAMASRFFDSIEIIEAHHASKVDSPSGTAVRTAELMGAARGVLGPVVAPHVDQRARGQQVSSIPIHSLRMQGVVAKQDVIFGGNGEVLTISHDTLAPSAYEAGILLALRAVRTARGVTVGLDKLIDLGLEK